MNTEEFYHRLHGLIGKECWSLVYGKGSGSIVSIGLGKKIPAKHISKNEHLTNDERRFDSEFSLLIYCSWKITHEEKIICSWSNANEYERTKKCVEKLRGKSVTDIEFKKEGKDIDIIFDEGLRFSIFPDVTDDDDPNSNYIVFFPEISVGVGPTGEFSYKNR